MNRKKRHLLTPTAYGGSLATTYLCGKPRKREAIKFRRYEPIRTGKEKLDTSGICGKCLRIAEGQVAINKALFTMCKSELFREYPIITR